jgi:predicted nucleotidyltransferase
MRQSCDVASHSGLDEAAAVVFYNWQEKGVAIYLAGMDRQSVIATLQAHQAELQRRGVRHAALFGSVARGDARPDSDIDIDLDEDALTDLFAYAGMKRYIAGLFPGPVDVVDRAALKPWVSAASIADLVYAF